MSEYFLQEDQLVIARKHALVSIMVDYNEQQNQQLLP